MSAQRPPSHLEESLSGPFSGCSAAYLQVLRDPPSVLSLARLEVIVANFL